MYKLIANLYSYHIKWTFLGVRSQRVALFGRVIGLDQKIGT